MAFFEIKNVRIIGFAAGVPKNVEPTISTNDKYDAASFIETTGVIEKRYSQDFTTSDYCEAAAEHLIKDLKWDKQDIDAIVFVSQTADYILPATSCVLHGKMGLKKDCFTLDISLGCSGWVYGLNTLMSLMQSGAIKKALLMAGDARGQVVPKLPPDQLFGHAGTVTALEYGDFDDVYRFDMGSDGTGYDAIIKPYGGTRNQMSKDTFGIFEDEKGKLTSNFVSKMKGMDVFAFGITTAPKSVKKLAKHFEFDYLDYDYFVFHQANKKMNKTIEKKLKLDTNKVPYCMPNFGNTSSASIPLTIVTQLKDKVENSPTKFICCGFGVGLSWGTVAFETKQLVISNLVEI